MSGNIGNINLGLGLNLKEFEESLKKAQNMLQELRTQDVIQMKGNSFSGTNKAVEAVKQLNQAFKSIDWTSDMKEADNTALKLANSFTELTNSNKAAFMGVKDYAIALDKNNSSHVRWVETRSKMERDEQRRVTKVGEKAARERKRLIDEDLKIRKQAHNQKMRMIEMENKRQYKEGLMAYSSREANQIMTTGESPRTIAARTAKIQQLDEVKKRLDNTDSNYSLTLSRLNREISKLTKENQRYMNQGVRVENQTRKLGEAAAWASRKLAFYTSAYALERFANKLVKIRGEFELQQKSLAAILQNKYAADKLFAQTVDLALQSPFKLREMVGFTRQLSAYRVETENLFDVTKRLADVSAGLGVDMGRLILAYGQVRSAAVLRGQELRQFTEAGIPIIAELSKKFSELYQRGVSTAEVFDLVSRRMVPFKMVDEIFRDMTESGGMFYNMQKIQAQTLIGKLSNLQDAFDVMLNSIGESRQSILNFTVDTLRSMLENFELVISNLTAIGIGFVAYKAWMATNRLVTERFAASLIKGSGALKAYSGYTYEAAAANMKLRASLNQSTLSTFKFDAATWKASAGTKNLNKDLYILSSSFNKSALSGIRLSKGMYAMNIASLRLTAGFAALRAGAKALWASLWPLLVVSAAVEGVLLLIDRNRKIKQLEEDVAKFTGTIMASGEEVNNQTKIVLEHAKAYEEYKKELAGGKMSVEEQEAALKKLTKSRVEANNAIVEIAKTEGGYANSLRNSIEDTKGLTLAQNEFNDALALTINLRELASKEGSKRTKTLSDDFSDYDELLAKIKGTEHIVESNLQLMYYRLREASKDGTEESMSDYRAAGKIIESNLKTSSEKLLLMAQVAPKKLRKNVDIELAKSTWALEADAEKKNKRIEKQIKNVGDKWKEMLLSSGYELNNASMAIINQLNRSIESVFANSELSKRIANYVGLPASTGVPNETTGWRKVMEDTFQGYIGDVSEFTADNEAQLSDVLEAIGTRHKEALEVIKIYENMSQEALESTGDKAKLEDLRNLVSLYDSFLKKYNYNPKETKETKDLVLESWKQEIALIEKASNTYKEYLNVMSQEKAAAKTSDLYNIPKDKYDTPASVINVMSQMMAMARKRGTKESLEFARDLAEKIGKLEFQVDEKSLESLKKRVAKAFETYEITNQFKELGLDAAKIVGESLSLEALTAGIERDIESLRKIGGEKQLEEAKSLEDKLADIRIKGALDTAREIESIRKSLMDDQEKAAKIESDILKWQTELAIIANDSKKEMERELLGLKIKNAQVELRAINETVLKSSELYMRLFGDISEMSVKQLSRLANNASAFVEGMSWDTTNKEWSKTEVVDGVDTKSAVSAEEYIRILKQIASIQKDVTNKRPFARLIKAWEDVAVAAEKAKKAKEAIDGSQESMDRAEEAQEDKANAMGRAAEEVGKFAAEMVDIASSMLGIGEALGLDEHTVAQIGNVIGIMGGAGEVANGVGKIMQGDIVEGIKGVVKGIGNVVKGIVGLGDAKHEQTIKRHEKLVEDLTEAYSNLSEAINDAFDMEQLGQDMQKMNANIRNRINSLNAMRTAEESKKKSDQKRLDDYATQIRELSKEQKQIWEDFYEGLRGTNIQSFADDLASIWYEAKVNSENSMIAIEGRFDEMIKNIIIKQASMRIIGRMLEPLFKQIDSYMDNDGVLSVTEMESISKVIPDYVKKIDEALNATMMPIIDAAGGLQKLGGESGLQRGIKSITEDSAQQLVALINTIRYSVYRQEEVFKAMDASLVGIQNVMSDSLYHSKETHMLISEMRNWQKSITFAGHNKGGNGLKVFTNE